jgi:hypothetical protein
MIPGIGWGAILKVGALLAAIAAGYFAVAWVRGIVAENATLRVNQKILQSTIDEQLQNQKLVNDRLAEVLADQQKLNGLINDFADAYNANAAELADLRQTFARHNLRALSDAKPGLIERRINDGTVNVIRLLNESGNLRTETDRGASKGPDIPSAPAPEPRTDRD